MTDKLIMNINGEKIQLPSYNDLKVEYPTLDDYADFIMEINGENFKVKILKSDFERIKSILDRKGGSDE